MIEALNTYAGAVTGLATIALLAVTAAYAWITYLLLKETKLTRQLSAEPRVVAYLRLNPTHTNIVQLHIANLSDAAAIAVTASIEKITEWPDPFDLQDSKILRDLSFLPPHEVLPFDLGMGPSLFKDNQPAKFSINIIYEGLDGRRYTFTNNLRVESVEGHSLWQIYSIDDVARRLKEISDTLKGFTGFQRLKVETYSSADRNDEAREREEQREALRRRNSPSALED